MRDAVRVRMTQEQFLAFRDLLSAAYNAKLLKTARYNSLGEFLKTATADFVDDPGDLIQRARDEYHHPDDANIDIDDDAPLSRTPECGVWVGAWVWVHVEDDEDDVEAESDTQ